ncbi:MAG: CapA family protein [Clostridia bacterium]|nr:CapA family protein [Clostridia bacterium]
MKKLSTVLILVALLFICGCSESEHSPLTAPKSLMSDTIHSSLELALEEPLPPDVTLSFAGCGDNIMYYGNYRDAKSIAIAGGRTYNFAPIYENILSIIKNADISFINQETPTAGEEFGYNSYPRFNAPQDLAYDIVEAGFDIVNLATNHMLDAGSQGLKNTIEFWNTLPVMTVGGYLDNADYENIRIYEKDDISIAFLSFTYGTNGLSLRSGYDIVIPYIDEDEIQIQIEAAKELADLVFVSMHWGSEYKFTPNTQQKSLANMMAKLGVDVIIGHHPHVLQPIEWIDSGNGDGHRTLCVYSLGNLAAEQEYDYNLVGGIITFDIVRKKGKISIENPILVPTVYYYNRSFYKNSVHLMENFTEDMAKSIGLSYYGRSTTLQKLMSYVKQTISPEFLPDFIK